MGLNEAQILKQAVRQNLPIPDKIKNAPVLLPGLQFYFQSFLELSTCREIGMSEGQIPWTAIDRYASRYEMTEDDYERFLTLIRIVDAEYIRYRAKKNAPPPTPPGDKAVKHGNKAI